jgi:hypothetical protein
MRRYKNDMAFRALVDFVALILLAFAALVLISGILIALA